MAGVKMLVYVIVVVVVLLLLFLFFVFLKENTRILFMPSRNHNNYIKMHQFKVVSQIPGHRFCYQLRMQKLRSPLPKIQL